MVLVVSKMLIIPLYFRKNINMVKWIISNNSLVLIPIVQVLQNGEKVD